MATAVTHSILFSQAWTEIYNLVNTALGSSMVSIYAQWPDKPLTKKTDYPLAIVNRVRLVGDEFVSFEMRNALINCVIELYSTVNANLDTYSDTLYNAFRTTSRTLGGGSKMEVMSIADSDDEDFARDGIKLHARYLTIEFKVIGVNS